MSLLPFAQKLFAQQVDQFKDAGNTERTWLKFARGTKPIALCRRISQLDHTS